MYPLKKRSGIDRLDENGKRTSPLFPLPTGGLPALRSTWGEGGMVRVGGESVGSKHFPQGGEEKRLNRTILLNQTRFCGDPSGVRVGGGRFAVNSDLAVGHIDMDGAAVLEFAK